MPKRRTLPSVMKHAFSSVPTANIRRSVFDRSSGLKTTLFFDYLIPIYIDEVLPGDTFSMKMSHVARLASSLKTPIMDNISMTTQWFYVPNRLLWDSWEDFIAGVDDPTQWTMNANETRESKEKPGTPLQVPQLTAPKYGYPSSVLRVGQSSSTIQNAKEVFGDWMYLYDFFGLPTSVPGYKHSALPFRAYELIYNEYYRDENLENEYEYSWLKADDKQSPFSTGDFEPVIGPTGDIAGEFSSWFTRGENRPYLMRKRNKRYDYFTSALPRPQKGNEINLLAGLPTVPGGGSGGGLPLSSRLPVHGFSFTGASPVLVKDPNLANQPYLSAPSATNANASIDLDRDFYGQVDATIISPNQTPTYYAAQGSLSDDVWRGPGFYANVRTLDSGGQEVTSLNKIPAWFSNNPFIHWDGDIQQSGSQYYTKGMTSDNWPLYVDLNEGGNFLRNSLRADTALTVNTLRQGIVLQQWMEKCARYGTRYIEAMQGHFGVHCGDYRVQRPEYLGGSKTYININPVAQTSQTTGGGALGDLGASGASSGTKHLFTKSFVEHGLIIGIACVTADLTYQQGLDRSPWSKKDRFDFYWPSFAHLGEQPVLNKEIYCQNPATQDPTTKLPVNEMPFGYQERYAEYRYKPSKITGMFRTPVKVPNSPSVTAPVLSYDQWHLSQYFSEQPKLNTEFMKCETPIKRALSVVDRDEVLVDYYFKCKSVRPLPVYSVPGLKRL